MNTSMMINGNASNQVVRDLNEELSMLRSSNESCLAAMHAPASQIEKWERKEYAEVKAGNDARIVAIRVQLKNIAKLG